MRLSIDCGPRGDGLQRDKLDSEKSASSGKRQRHSYRGGCDRVDRGTGCKDGRMEHRSHALVPDSTAFPVRLG